MNKRTFERVIDFGIVIMLVLNLICVWRYYQLSNQFQKEIERIANIHRQSDWAKVGVECHKIYKVESQK